MYLFRKAQNYKASNVVEQLMHASGYISKFDNLPQGFDSIVNFDLGDIYVDDCLSERLNEDTVLEINTCLLNLKRGNYGICSENEIADNEESRWLGNGELSARYNVSFGIIQINKMRDKTEIKWSN